MGSKRSSSENRSKASEPNPLVEPPAAGNPGLASPAKSSKKSKPSSGFRSPTPSADSPAPSEKNRRKAVPEEDDNIPRKASTATRGGGGSGDAKPAAYTVPLRWANDQVLKLLRAVAAFRSRNGIVPTPATIPIFLEEIKDWAPKSLSEKQLIRKLANLRKKFRISPAPGPWSSDFDWWCYKLALEAWGADKLDSNSKGNGSVKKNGEFDGEIEKMKANKKRKDDKKEEDKDDVDRGEKEKVSKKRKEDKKAEEKKETDKKEKASKKVEEDEKEEENEEDTKDNKDSEDEEGKSAHGKTESIEVEEDDVEDGNAQYRYKYLKLALEKFWTENNLDINTLQLALQKVDPIQAKHIDERFLVLLREELKFEMEKNWVSIAFLEVIADGACLD